MSEMRWPFVRRSVFEAATTLLAERQMENYTLRDALKEANAEIRRLKLALASKEQA